MQEILISLLREYGYIILFLWSVLEGETGLVMAGILSYTGDMELILAITTAALGGFSGDQIYFYIGRFNKNYINKQLIMHRRKFALANLLLKKFGWPIIFLQRYIYGMRTIIPIAIGITRYDSKLYAFINLISAFVWASITILLAYTYGEEILNILHYVKDHVVYLLPFGILTAGAIYYYFNKATQKK